MVGHEMEVSEIGKHTFSRMFILFSDDHMGLYPIHRGLSTNDRDSRIRLDSESPLKKLVAFVVRLVAMIAWPFTEAYMGP